MAVTNRTPVSCADCSYWEALYNWSGVPYGGICHNNEEYHFEPDHGELGDFPCHTLYERMEAYYDDRD